MKIQKLFGVTLTLTLFLTLIYVTNPFNISAQGGDPPPTDTTVETPPPPLSSQATEPIIIDHTCTDLSKIPDYWLNEAKKLAIHYAHTSHGGQIIQGLDKLETVDSKYSVNMFGAGGAPPSSLPSSCSNQLCLYDGNPPETYIEPGDYWATQGGINRTQAVATTGLFKYSMWSWCGQVHDYSTEQIQAYLHQMTQFETNNPNMRFIMMTGHTDTEAKRDKIIYHNNLIRQYAITSNMVLFDFADIETYDPLGGGPHYINPDGNCTWCADFCDAHPEYCANLPSGCSHSDGEDSQLFCKLKANAFWWMMARLAGWSGPSAIPQLTTTITASPPTADVGQTISYTIVLRSSAPLTDTVNLSSIIPSGLTYISDSATATLGAPDVAGSTLTWSGILSPTTVVTITYGVTVETPDSQAIVNNVTVSTPSGVVSTTHTIIVNGQEVYLPIILKGP